MPSERIGDCGCAQYPDKDWIIAELELGICYIRHACGDPPAGYELEIIWHEHDVGEYAEIGVTWEGYGHAPWEYISRAENALSRLDNAVAWSELAPEPEEAKAETSLDEAEDVSNEEGDSDNDASRSISQQTLLVPADDARRPLELYRRDEMIEADQKDWHMTLLLFQEMGWNPERPLEAYANPLTFVKADEGVAMQRAGRLLFELIQKEPFISASVQMDLGLFYRFNEFVGGGAFIVGVQELTRTHKR